MKNIIKKFIIGSLLIATVHADTNVVNSEEQLKLNNLDKLYSSKQIFTDAGLDTITTYINDPNPTVNQAGLKMAYLVSIAIHNKQLSYKKESYDCFIKALKLKIDNNNAIDKTSAIGSLLLISPKSENISNTSLWLIHKSPYAVRGPILILLVQAGYNTPNLGIEILKTIKEGEALELQGETACYNSQLFGAIGLLKPKEGIAEILDLINSGHGSTSAVRALAAYGPDAAIALPRLKELVHNPLVRRSDGAQVGIPVEEVIHAISIIEKGIK